MTDGEPNTELSALVRQAVLDALASAAPLQAPPAVTPLTVQQTPILGLKMPQYTDAADILILNDNMVTLDGSITATQAVTLTNKTLTAPILNNPTVNGWGNANHTHLDPASAGPLDGAAIVSGDIGTGNVVRESHVDDRIALAFSGGGTDLVTPDLIDPVVRDTLWWGPAPTGAPDTSLKRLAAQSLALFGDISLTRIGPAWARWSGGIAPALDLRSTKAGVTTGMHLLTAADASVWAWNARTNPAGDVWMRDDVTKRSASITQNPTDALAVFATEPGTTGLPDDPLTWKRLLTLDYVGNLALTSAGLADPAQARAWLTLQAQGAGSSGRIGQPTGGPTTQGVWLMANAQYQQTPPAWNRDNVAVPAVHVSLGTNDPAAGAVVLNIGTVLAGANPITWRSNLYLQNNGTWRFGGVPLGTGVGVAEFGGNIGLSHLTNPWHANYRAIDGVGGSVSWDAAAGNRIEVRSNSYMGTDAQYHAAIGSIAAVYTQWYGGGLYFGTAPIVAAGAVQALTVKTTMNTQGGWQYNPETTVQCSWQWPNKALVVTEGGGNNAAIYSAYFLELYSGSNIVAPKTSNTQALGWGDKVWTAVYAQNGAIQPSTLDTKTDLNALDPKACAEAVLLTDWVSFTYVPPVPDEPLDIQGPPIPPGEEDAPQHREARDARAAMKADAYRIALENVQTSAYTRRQKGYVLQSDAHKVHDLFGLPDRAHASPQSDLAVVACALQGALQRIAALEASGEPDAPTGTSTRTRRRAS